MWWPYQSTEWFVISPFQVVCKAWYSVATREVPLEKKVDTKYIQVNVLRNIASMTKRGDDILIHYIGRKYSDALGMWRGCSVGEGMQDRVKSCFDLRVTSETYQ